DIHGGDEFLVAEGRAVETGFGERPVRPVGRPDVDLGVVDHDVRVASFLLVGSTFVRGLDLYIHSDCAQTSSSDGCSRLVERNLPQRSISSHSGITSWGP